MKFRKGQKVKIIKQSNTGNRTRSEYEFYNTKPDSGRVVWVHPRGKFYVVELFKRGTETPIYKESFFPEQIAEYREDSHVS